MRGLTDEIDWLLPAATLEQMRARADRRRPFWRDTDGRLEARVRVRDGRGRLVVRIVRLGRHRGSFTLRAGLTQEPAGVRVRGRVPRADITSVAVDLALLAGFIGLAVVGVVQRSLLDPLALLFVTFAAAFAWHCRGLVSRTRTGYQRELVELEGKVRSRFSGEPQPGAPWIVEPAEGTGYRPFTAQPLIRVRRRGAGGTGRERTP